MDNDEERDIKKQEVYGTKTACPYCIYDARSFRCWHPDNNGGWIHSECSASICPLLKAIAGHLEQEKNGTT
jgi:hypothetical protein